MNYKAADLARDVSNIEDNGNDAILRSTYGEWSSKVIRLYMMRFGMRMVYNSYRASEIR